MTLREISNIRLISQCISRTKFNTAGEVTGWMGAVQAQDYNMAKWALGIRLQDPTSRKIENSIARGEIIRTHLMRPTWHFVSADDIGWMLDLTGPNIITSLKSRQKALELTGPVLSKCTDILEKSLPSGQSMTREEIEKEFNKAGISTKENRLSHILIVAELEKRICSGPEKNGIPTYALLEEQVKLKKMLSREESLHELGKRYFTSHSPATLQDFIWWSGLSVRDAKISLETNKGILRNEIADSAEYWFSNSSITDGYDEHSVHLLPAYDEFLISYKDRSASLLMTHKKKTISNNGIFHPVIIEDGQVTGTWKRTIRKDKVLLELVLFKLQNKADGKLLEKCIYGYGQFLNKEIEVI